MAPFRVQRAIVGVMAETSASTYLKPTNAFLFHARSINYKPTASVTERNVTRSHFGNMDDIPGASEAEVSFECDLASGTLGGVPPHAAVAGTLLPEWDGAMMACGHQRGMISGATGAWVLSTAYKLGHVVKNGTSPVKVYVCIAAGTSAGSGGPTTTAASISDGGVTWKYVSSLPVAWVISTAYTVTPGLSMVTSSGKLYVCITAGTSHASTVLDGTGADITDGTAHWKFLGYGSAIVGYKPASAFDGSATSDSDGFAWVNPSETYSASVWEASGAITNSVKYSLKGGWGNVSMSTAQGQPLALKFSLKGAYVASMDEDVGMTVTDEDTSPPAFLGATVSIFGQSGLSFDGFDFDKGNVLSKRASSSDANGVKGYWQTAHKPTIKFAPEMVTVATYNFMNSWRQGTTGVFTASFGAATPGCYVTFSCPRAQLSDLSLGEREGARTLDLGLKLTGLGTDATGLDYVIYVHG